MIADDYEFQIRALAAYPSDGAWKADVVPYLLRQLDAERERIDKARAACAVLGDQAIGILAALDGDQALNDPYQRSVDA